MTSRPSLTTMERAISTVLLVGIASSSILTFIGLALFLTHSHQIHASYRNFTGPTYSFPHSVSELRTSIRGREGVGLIELGILLLILTPILRVATSVLLFKRHGDRPMMFVTLFVLLAVASSFILGLLIK